MQAENIQGRCYNVAVELTDREREVLTLLASGLRRKDVASRMNITLSTVKRHVEHVRSKTGTEGKNIAAVVSVVIGQE